MGALQEEYARRERPLPRGGCSCGAGDCAGRGRSVDSSGPSIHLWAIRASQVTTPGVRTGEMRELAPTGRRQSDSQNGLLRSPIPLRYKFNIPHPGLLYHFLSC